MLSYFLKTSTTVSVLQQTAVERAVRQWLSRKRADAYKVSPVNSYVACETASSARGRPAVRPVRPRPCAARGGAHRARLPGAPGSGRSHTYGRGPGQRFGAVRPGAPAYAQQR